MAAGCVMCRLVGKWDSVVCGLCVEVSGCVRVIGSGVELFFVIC